jgi:hypothetical protein
MRRETCRMITLPKIGDPRGNLTFIEGGNHIPLEISRAYWIYDVPGGEMRGGHAYRSSRELVVAVSGSFEVVINDGLKETRYLLNRSYYGLYIPAMNWRELVNFSTNSLCYVLSSSEYDEGDYIRDFATYQKLVEG